MQDTLCNLAASPSRRRPLPRSLALAVSPWPNPAWPPVASSTTSQPCLASSSSLPPNPPQILQGRPILRPPPHPVASIPREETKLELYVEREPAAKKPSSLRFTWGGSFRKTDKGKKENNLKKKVVLPLEEGEGGGSGHLLRKHKHRIVFSDVVFKNRWSDVNSVDLISLKSEMLNLLSSKWFSSTTTRLCHNWPQGATSRAYTLQTPTASITTIFNKESQITRPTSSTSHRTPSLRGFRKCRRALRRYSEAGTTPSKQKSSGFLFLLYENTPKKLELSLMISLHALGQVDGDGDDLGGNVELLDTEGLLEDDLAETLYNNHRILQHNSNRVVALQ
ncbi:hypothetical protein Taro_040124 [Colocasia esculenta]|uniref:Uncharacterized protein n=1 Tax=Colocasia esculenta TaxID=4460 RepID=A0A843WI92_COLES|nr:hypothetical protein [Colocasia esculenta]